THLLGQLGKLPKGGLTHGHLAPRYPVRVRRAAWTFALAGSQALMQDACQPGHSERAATDIGNLPDNLGAEHPCEFLGMDGHGQAPRRGKWIWYMTLSSTQATAPWLVWVPSSMRN